MEDEFYDILFPPYTGHVKIGGLYYDLYIDRDTLERTAEVVRDPEASSERANYPDLTVARIPASVTYRDEQYRVTAIGNNAFEGCSRLSAVELPDTITGIGEMAFFGCENLTAIVLPDSVTRIGTSAFSYCELESLHIPDGITTITAGAFCHHSKLTSIVLPASIDDDVRRQVYPYLRQAIADMTETDAANYLLHWVQTHFDYKTDGEAWGYERAFFPTETLYYPYCDCEDRSILYSRLMRDLVGSDVILLLVPNHMATGVHFKQGEGVYGTYLEIEGNKYYICDPTITGAGAPIGTAQKCMENQSVTYIKI